MGSTTEDSEYTESEEIGLSYKGRPLRQNYRADLVCFGKVIVEIKAVSSLTDEHRAQLMNYCAPPTTRSGCPLIPAITLVWSTNAL